MNWQSWLVWGFAATIVLTGVMSVSQGLRLTRMSLPYMLGTIFTPDRDRAKWVGFLVHLLDGWFFSLIYVQAFHAWDRITWWFGVIIGAVHGGFVLTAGMRLLPGLHPRMASEEHGPATTPQLEPPGFLALNYGVRTPISVFVAHLVYGAILGAFYTP